MSDQRPAHLRLTSEKRADEQRARESAEEHERRVLQEVMSTSLGREFVAGHLIACGLYTATVHTNGIVMAGNEGERRAGERLRARLERVVPELYDEMMRESRVARLAAQQEKR